MPYKGYVVHQFPFLDLGQGLFSYMDFSLIALKLSGKQTGNGTFPTAGLSYQRHKGTLGNNQADPFQDFSVLFVRKPYILQFYIKVLRRHFLFSLFWFLQIQEMKNLVTGCHTVHGNVEKGSQKPQGNKKL